MQKVLVVVGAIVSLSLTNCATSASSQLETAERKAESVNDQYSEKANELRREQVVEGAELSQEHASDKVQLTREYREDVAEADQRVSEARAELYVEYVKFLADNQSRVSGLRARLNRVEQQASATNGGDTNDRAGTRGSTPNATERLADADRTLKTVQTALDDAGTKSSKDWDAFKQTFQRDIDAAERAIGEAERTIASR